MDCGMELPVSQYNDEIEKMKEELIKSLSNPVKSKNW